MSVTQDLHLYQIDIIDIKWTQLPLYAWKEFPKRGCPIQKESFKEIKKLRTYAIHLQSQSNIPLL